MSAQLEDGYTRIANEILEQLAQVKLSPSQYRAIFIVWRYTYGFGRKEHDLSLQFISTATGCDKRQLQRDLKDLEERSIIYQRIKNGAYRIIGFNKNYEQWNQTIGKTTNGNSTDGETPNGEITNGTIGRTTNQERKKKSTTTTDEPERQETVMDVYTKVFNQFFMSPLQQDFFSKLRKRGFTDVFVKELLYEVGECGTKPSLRYMETIANDWIAKGIYTRTEAKRQKERRPSAGTEKPSEREARTQQRLAEERKQADIIPFDLRPEFESAKEAAAAYDPPTRPTGTV